MNTCKTCKWWEGKGDGPAGCGHEKFVYTGDGQAIPSDGVGYTDYEGYSAWLMTGPDFGCIHHEENAGAQ